MNTIKGILIDPAARLISNVDIPTQTDGNCLHGLYSAIGCDCVDFVHVTSSADLIVDDEGLCKPGQSIFQIHACGRPMKIAGKAVLLGFEPETGWHRDIRVPLLCVADRVEWTDYRTV